MQTNAEQKQHVNSNAATSSTKNLTPHAKNALTKRQMITAIYKEVKEKEKTYSRLSLNFFVFSFL